MALEDFKEKSLQAVKNGNMLFNQVKTINKEREKILVLIMNEVVTNGI